jgi:Tfp pilus assembly protein PilO
MNTASLTTFIKKQPIGCSCGLLCIAFAIVLYFRSSKIDDYQSEYEAKSAERSQILANVRNSEHLREQVTEMQAHAKEMESRLVHAGQLAVNLQYFYKLEAENEVKLGGDLRQGVLSRPAKGLYVGVPYNVTVQGSYKHVFSFLQRLEAGAHFCRFNTVSFTKLLGGSDVPGDAGGANTAMNLSLNIELLGTP